MNAVIQTLCMLLEIYAWVIFIYILMSWLPHENGFLAKVYDALGMVCEPFLKLFRKILPPVGGRSGAAIDFSPIIAFVALQLVEMLLRRLLL